MHGPGETVTTAAPVTGRSVREAPRVAAGGECPDGTASDPATVVGLVLAQASRTPDTVAVEADDGRLSYRRLVAHADAVARHLRGLGVGPGDVVAVALPRGIDLVPVLLAVQLTGAAYLPIDPDVPIRRVRYLVTDAHVGVLLVDEPATYRGLTDVDRVVLTDVVVPAEAPARVEVDAADDGAAYVIYTSGSSGAPKGVVVGHPALTNFVRSIRELLALPADLVLPAITTVSFDIAGLELFVPLTSGGRVVLADRATVTDPQRLATLLEHSGARVLQATPVSWRMLLDGGWTPPEGFTVLCGGERLPAELARRLRDHRVVLWDLYGPTETTIWSTATRYQHGVPTRFHPLAATTLHVLDDDLRPVEHGELYIGGSGLAIGYHARAGLTARRFVADPTPGAVGRRVYRTGDRARRHPDGRVEVLGRVDDQLKIRGFRVEPGEVEAVLGTHPDVAACAVGARPDASGAATLVGYVQPADPAEPPGERTLRRHLERSLPDYLVPAGFVSVETLPTTPNGKLDRAALADTPPRTGTTTPGGCADTADPEPDGTDGETAAVERRVSAVLADALERDAIGRHDDFFALGGDSLRAVQAILRLNAEFDRQVPINALFETRTAYGLARLLDGRDELEPELGRLPDGRAARLSSAQWRLWLHQLVTPASTVHNRAVVVRVPDNVDDVTPVVQGLVDRHDILRTRYGTDEAGHPAPVEEPTGGVGRVETVDEATDRVVAGELGRAFDLAAAPPVRAVVAREATGDRRLVVAVHEIAADTASRALIARQLRAALAGRPCADPPLRYVDYADWQRALAAGTGMRRHLDFWRTTLAGLAPAALRTDRPRSADRDHRAGTVRFTLPADVVAALRTVARDQDATPALALLTALFVTLGGHVDGTDLTVGVPADGRTRPDLRYLVGALENTTTIRTALDSSESFARFLGRVRTTALAAFGHTAAPLDDVVAAVVDTAMPTPPGRGPLFDVTFSLQEAPATEFGMPDRRHIDNELHCGLAEHDDGSIEGRLEYLLTLFDDTTVARFADDYVRLVGAMAADPHRRPADVLPRYEV